jgi:hypothetical protein
MPKFYINLRRGDDDLPNDPEPREFPNLEAAKTEAIESLRELSGRDYDGIDIVGHNGVFLLRVPMPKMTKSKRASPKLFQTRKGGRQSRVGPQR